jgi:hypothetical protein
MKPNFCQVNNPVTDVLILNGLALCSEGLPSG